nr:WSC domain-containing protein ARB_07867 [Halyomorpha halys]
MWFLTVLLFATAQLIDGKLLGCYQDNDVRLVAAFRNDLPGIDTPARCMYLCQRLQYEYAGVQNENQCFCGRNKPYQLLKVDSNKCSSRCPFSEEICGGYNWFIAIYSVDSYIYPKTDLRHGTYIGCYLEHPEDRTLRNFQSYLWHQNSPTECTQVCSALGYLYAGVVDYECTCGNTMPAGERKEQDSECQTTCINGDEICGGDGRISIYRTSVDPNAESVVTVSDERLKQNAIGCFEDSERRILPEYYASLVDINSPKNCLYLCQQLGFPYAGVHNGTECYCGKQLPTLSRKKGDEECQVACPHSSERCGGNMRIYVYSTQKFQSQHISDLGNSGHSTPFMKKHKKD